MNNPDQIVLAFSADQTARLTGLSHRQLAYWDHTGFFQPEYVTKHARTPYGRIYSFKDVVGLRTLSVLRGKHGVSLPHLRKVAKDLASYSRRPWSEIQLAVWDRQVVFVDPDTGVPCEVLSGQYILLPLIEIIEDVKRAVEAMKRRGMNQFGKVERHRHISHNATVISGTRVPVATVRRFLEDGYSIEDILREYPSLTESDIRAVQSGTAA